jgi:hypothetical protein
LPSKRGPHHGARCERNCVVDEPSASLFTLLEVHRQAFGTIIARGVGTTSDADRLIDEHVRALVDGTGLGTDREVARMPWRDFALNPFPDLFATPPGGVSVKVKDALLRKRLTDRQIGVAYDHLTRRTVFGDRRRPDAWRRLRRRADQSSRRRSRGSPDEHVRRAVVDDLLQGQLPAAASESKRGSIRSTYSATRCPSASIDGDLTIRLTAVCCGARERAAMPLVARPPRIVR